MGQAFQAPKAEAGAFPWMQRKKGKKPPDLRS